MVVPYSIKIFSEETDSIIEIVDALWDTKVKNVMIHDAPGLTSLRFHNVKRFDFTGCPNLEYLDCDYYSGDVLDLTNLAKMTGLRCQMGEASTICLPKSSNLISLDLFGCKMKTLKVSNDTKLQSLCIQSCDSLKSQTKTWLEKNIADNNGHIISPF